MVATSIVTWGSRRLTRKGRLLLRIKRLGTAYELLPDSIEKSHLTEHVNDLASELNNLLDNKKARRIQRIVSTWSYIVGIIVILALLLLISLNDPRQSLILGTVIGLLIAMVTILASLFLERKNRRQSERAEKAREAAAQDQLLERLKSPTADSGVTGPA